MTRMGIQYWTGTRRELLLTKGYCMPRLVIVDQSLLTSGILATRLMCVFYTSPDSHVSHV
jgi:hypothetical protein